VSLRNRGPDVSYGSTMAAMTHPRGRLPARVYWFRRTLVLSTALGLVFAVAQVLGGSDPGPDTKATNAAGSPTSAPTSGPMGPVPAKTGAAAPKGGSQTLPQPDGPCAVDQVTVTPNVRKVTAGRAITLTFELTGIRPACTFEVSSRSLVAKVVVGPERIWSTQECPRSIAKRDVVVRSGTTTEVNVVWSGRKSSGQCGQNAAWALPGSYRLIAAAIGSEPSEDKFRLVAPERATVIKTVQPKPTGKPKATVNAGP